MGIVYFPGCRIKMSYPNESAKLQDYIMSRYPVRIGNCCRTDWGDLFEDDIAAVVCNNCHEILCESSRGQVASVWRLVDEDLSFRFPDYGGEKMSLVDCWAATGNKEVHDAVRSLLSKMNITILETSHFRDRSRFCGPNILADATESNASLAPRRWIDRKKNEVPLIPEVEWGSYFKKQCADIATERVACYCGFCAGALKSGGKTPLHLLQLLFPD